MIVQSSRRLAEFVIVFLGVTFLILAGVFALPGDPIAALGGNRPLSPSVVAQLRAEYHLDESLWQQYLHYLGALFSGDLGTSFSGRPVADMMAERWPTTIRLALTTWVMEAVGGIVLGVIAGVRRGTWIDKNILLLTIVVSSIPVFVLGVTARLVFGVHLGIFPVAGTAAGWPMAYILPAAVTAVFGLAAVARLTRGSVADTLNSDFVRTHRAKGFSDRRILGIHVSRNAAIPVLTLIGVSFGALLGGTVFVESVFNLPGIGQLLVTAIQGHDGALVVGVATALVMVFLITNLAVDLLATVLDPRIRRG
ncbi:ABC transporter permease [Paenarthrobacter sp. NPDC091669]|uniref:ABC transporter permease n=1 Tax=Paenarthrobacter sp. NPDC091669 TaxID=3364384 RepID=UPI00380AFC29